MSGGGGGGDGDADAAGMEDLGLDSVSMGQSTEDSAPSSVGGAISQALNSLHNAIQNPNSFSTVNSPGSVGLLGITGNIAAQTAQAVGNNVTGPATVGLGGETSGTGSTPGDGTDANDGSGSQADAAGAVGPSDPPAPLPTPGTPNLNKPPFQIPPPARAEPEPPREVTPLPKIGTSPLDSIFTEPEEDKRPKTASKIQDEVEEASRKRFLNEGGALGLRGTRGLTLARPEAFGVLRLGQ